MTGGPNDYCKVPNHATKEKEKEKEPQITPKHVPRLTLGSPD